MCAAHFMGTETPLHLPAGQTSCRAAVLHSKRYPSEKGYLFYRFIRIRRPDPDRRHRRRLRMREKRRPRNRRPCRWAVPLRSGIPRG